MNHKRTANLLAAVHQLLMDAAPVLDDEEMMQLLAQLRALVDRTERIVVQRWRGTA